MDYLFFGSLAQTELVEIVTSYDIMCQYSIHLWDCMKTYLNWLHVDHENRMTFHFLIPKFHLPAHIQPCQTRYSFNYNKHMGCTDGEAPERGWSHANALALSTWEMAPGSHQDTLDDHFRDGNWVKTMEIGEHLTSLRSNSSHFQPIRLLRRSKRQCCNLEIRLSGMRISQSQ